MFDDNIFLLAIVQLLFTYWTWIIIINIECPTCPCPLVWSMDMIIIIIEYLQTYNIYGLIFFAVFSICLIVFVLGWTLAAAADDYDDDNKDENSVDDIFLIQYNDDNDVVAPETWHQANN